MFLDALGDVVGGLASGIGNLFGGGGSGGGDSGGFLGGLKELAPLLGNVGKMVAPPPPVPGMNMPQPGQGQQPVGQSGGIGAGPEQVNALAGALAIMRALHALSSGLQARPIQPVAISENYGFGPGVYTPINVPDWLLGGGQSR